MNAKKLIILATIALGMFAISTANAGAQTHRTSGFAPRARTSHSFAGTRTGTWDGRNSGGRNWGGDWHHRNRDRFDNTIFISGFGFPFLGFGYPYGYGYGGYSPYGYYGGGYYGGGYGGGYYGNGYSGGPGYGGYGGSPYGDYGQQGYRGSGYGYGSGSRSGVAQMQQRLARAGYYRGPIDGIMGPRTRYALRAYRHDRGTGAYGMNDQQSR